jgi:hypothetical protein
VPVTAVLRSYDELEAAVAFNAAAAAAPRAQVLAVVVAAPFAAELADLRRVAEALQEEVARQTALRKEAEVATFAEVLSDYTRKPATPATSAAAARQQGRLSLAARSAAAFRDDDDDEGRGFDGRSGLASEAVRRRATVGSPAATERVSRLQAAAAGVPGVPGPWSPPGGPLTAPVRPGGGSLLAAAATAPGGGGGSASDRRSSGGALALPRRSFGGVRPTPFEPTALPPTTPAEFFAQLASKVVQTETRLALSMRDLTDCTAPRSAGVRARQTLQLPRGFARRFPSTDVLLPAFCPLCLLLYCAFGLCFLSVL